MADQPVSSAKLKKLRTPVRARFTKAFNELETEIKKNEVKKADVEKILRRLQTHHEKLSILNMRMEEALLRESASEDIFTAEYESVCEYEDNFSNIMTDYEALAEKDDVSTISGTAAMNYQLPKLDFKKFGGEPREWITFWSQFSTIDRDPQMPPETKFQYLFQATAENSEVREAVESFPPSADNYPKVIEYIKSRFEEDEMLFEIYVRDLLRNVRAKGKMSVVKHYDRLETQLRALETLGVARDKFAAMLYPLVESALPEDTLRVWERSQYNALVNAYKKFIPDYARLRTPLNNLFERDVTWVWDDKCQKAFTSLKESLTTHPTLHPYQEGLPCQVYCNASTLGIAGVLKQVHPDGKTYPVQYFSRCLRSHDRNYYSSELECLAIVESVDKFRWGGPSPTSKSFRQEINTIEVRTSLDLTDNTAATLCTHDMSNLSYTVNSGGTKGENRAMATEVGAIGYTNGKLLRGLDNRATPQQSKTIKKPLGRFLRICQINVEGLTTAKTEILERMGRDENIDIFALQETHISEDHISRRWNTRTNPDLCFVSTDHNNKPIPTTKRILKKFPKSQHHPIILEVGHFIPVTLKPFLPRWNLQKANWENFRAYIDQNINRIQPLPSNYFRFVGLLMKAGRKFIPRGHRKEYIPVGKGWDLLRKLGNAEATNSVITNITPNQIARHLETVSKVKIPKRKKKAMKARIKEEFSKSNNSSHLSSQVNITEIETAIKLTKKYKAAGNDEIPAEFLIELGKRAKSWLARFFTIIMETGNIPKEWRHSKILAVLKPGKEPTCSANFRPIALLCTTHKLLERIILARLTPILDPEIPVEQAGFRGNRSCCDRVASLTSFIENGFQLGMKSAVVLLDLSSAYDTVWIDGLIYKLAKVLKCKQTLNLLSSLLSPRKFTVYLNSKSSKEYTIYNGLPHGSVLSPLLYNWYTHDIPQTTSKKFIYADDTAILAQAKTFEELEIQLNKDLETLHNYFENWSLRLNPAKSVHCCFHLNNHRAERKLKLFINNSQITHSEHPKYLGIHLDRTLTFKTHLTKLKGKLSSRNNILHMLAGSSWGSDANTLRTSALTLIFSTAEYCAPVWEGSCHTKLIDTQLNSTLRIITGVCQPTRIDWLPVLAHISPPELRRKEATKKMYQKLLDSPDLEINPILQSPPKHRLNSRNPIWSRGNKLLSQIFNISEAWTNSWISSDIPNKNLITSPSVKIPGFSLPRREWVLLNRFRTGQGRCAELMKLWGYTKDPNCA
ncbi:hypothetical protein LAZ67_X002927 [Cordylochernes scorpioides]|uniref:Reverse transcriptase domain-containing protein n=1 Tax=Cordylochernes scorpioides TaxID=51811 RepID=A0ABY6LXX9_9ARAC|nr:hypothetical protein LAZ67_X002927 [Cordylochernes scorpioides]